MKVVCEKCESVFKAEVVKGTSRCPVCGASFDFGETEGNEVDTQVKSGKLDEGLMYFDEIMIFNDKPKLSGVEAYCSSCGAGNSLELDLFDELVDKDHVTLKENILVKCRGCGKEHKSRKIMYKRKDHYAPSLPRCPICNSAMLKKITKGSKFLAAATIGTFALPYNGKTFECKDCGYRF